MVYIAAFDFTKLIYDKLKYSK
uniref:Uncharacterized protein n=1 Tax=Anguilla anguilla TaxID=7936 RepID=A0A0E9QZK7_ANGAN